MRALHIYSGNLFGGVETMLVTLARSRHLCPQMETDFALCFEGRLSQELNSAGALVFQLGNVRTSRPASVLRARRNLREVLRGNKYDLVVCHLAWAQAIFGPVARECGIPLVFWLHGETNGTHWLERWARRTRPDLAICNSKFTAGALPKMYPGVPVEVIYCPVEEPERTGEERGVIRRKLNTPEEAVVVIQASRLEVSKGHEILLDALGKLRDVPGWVCWLIGGAQRKPEAQYFDKLKEKATRLGIKDRVHFLGQRSDVPRLLAAADIYCQPNVSPEGFGLSFVQALLAGLPVVTTPIGGATEIVNESCGAFVPPGDATLLSSALRELIRSNHWRGRLGSFAQDRAKSLCDPSAQMRRLYQSLGSI